MSISSSSVNKNKALLFLKNFSELNQLTIKDLPNSLESLIKSFVDKSLKNTTHIFEKFIKDQEQQKAFLEKNSFSQQWRLVFSIYPDFCQSSLEDIFLAAIQATPSSSKEEAQQIYTHLIEHPGVNLHQIYAQRCSAEVFAWMQNEIYNLPCDSILLLLKIWRNFDQYIDQNIDQTWKALLSLPSLSSSHRKELTLFQSKQNFINRNHKALQIVKLESVSTPGDLRIPTARKHLNPTRKHLNQYVLWAKVLNVFLNKVADACGLNIVGFIKNSWEYQLLYTPRDISSKILAWRAKNIFLLYQEKLKNFIEFFDEVIEPLKEAKQKVGELKCMLEIKQEGIPIYRNSNLERMKVIRGASLEEIKRDKTNKPVSEKEIKAYLEKWRKIENSLQIELMKPVAFREDISNIEYLMKKLSDSFQVKESKQEITQEQIALIEKNQKELIQAEYEYSSSQKKTFAAPIKESDSDSEVIEDSSSSDSESMSVTASNTPTLFKVSFAEIDAFLKEGGQVNGFLSKTIDGMLKQLKIHLSKTQVHISDELNIIRKEKIKEIHTQLVIATAALELIIQAIEDQRFDRVVLGFRSSLIHCHFAIEQMLSLKVLIENTEITNTHDLIELAEKAHIDNLEEKRGFLKDIGIHLWFCYPEDYRFFYPEESTHPKPFIFLQKLLHLYKNKEELDLVVLREAVQLCFGMYSQTIEFITEASSFPQENVCGFLKKMDEVQKQIQSKMENRDFNKIFSRNKTSISKKCNQALDMLKSVNKLENIQDFEELLLPINTIKGYLELIKISLFLPQEAHSLQEFFQVETMVNMDKLFKHLFRAIIFLQTGKNNYSHNLLALLQLTENFYKKDLITGQDRLDLKDLNISIAHHYLHKNSSISLKRDYRYIWDLAYRLNLLSARDFTLIDQRRKISYQNLKLEIGKIFESMNHAFKLFIKLLSPVITEVEQLSSFSE
ncbi:hypothetical protein [Candidatus Rhabdochlamydia porcellionis]|uniref:Uncharacterized protein n=1 Tax=Candidatus Rhabdochlamydia porcellionis TaxID=225148 RepID=A0ABX8YZS2_9BACT|nr:hypothetical protein [Candidatus Rhabdochlamydia porcellionis]QZA58904.1 hypothetical protein RHAB15C_0000785 [Candidatus Rhabdochlamydia porcellionis]